MVSKPTVPRPSVRALILLISSALASSGLALYQWQQLHELYKGNLPTCAINQTVNCASVWESPFASRVHEVFGVPLATLGLVWGLTALVLAGLLAWRSRGDAGSPLAAGVKLWAMAGALVTVTLITASIRAGAVCPTCVGTYVLVVGYLAGALMLPGGLWPSGSSLMSGGGWCAAVGAVSFLTLLYPGSQTKKPAASVIQGGGDAQKVRDALAKLSPRDAMLVSMARAEYLRSPRPDVSGFSPRVLLGPKDAPVHVVDFTDILCGHCRTFEEIARQVMASLPPGKIAFEPRYFPLDATCNREMQGKHPNQIRCLGAKVQVCLESHPKFWDIRHELFENQMSLTEELVLEIALKSGISRDKLLQCVDSYETQTKIDADVAFASKYHFDGTPLVLVNHRQTLPNASFLLAMALNDGNVDAPFFQNLPAPPPMQPHQH